MITSKIEYGWKKLEWDFENQYQKLGIRCVHFDSKDTLHFFMKPEGGYTSHQYLSIEDIKKGHFTLCDFTIDILHDIYKMKMHKNYLPQGLLEYMENA